MTTESFEIHGGSQDGRVFEFVIPFRPLTFSMDGHERYCLNPDNASFGLVAPDADLVIHKDERDVRFGSLDVPDDGMIDSTDALCEMTEAEIDNAFGKENADRAADAARRAIDRGLKQAALESRLSTLEAENAKLRAESREFRGMDASVGIANPCPSCGQAKLFVGTGGHLTCSGSKCRNPCAIGDVTADNAKLRDLLRRVRGCFRNGETPATIAIELSTLMPEIKAAIESSGEPGEGEGI